MKWDVTFRATIQKFPGRGGWVYAAVPKKYTNHLREQRSGWGMFPITAHVGDTSWKTKLMMKKGGDFFVVFKSAIRKKENITTGDSVTVSFKLG